MNFEGHVKEVSDLLDYVAVSFMKQGAVYL